MIKLSKLQLGCPVPCKGYFCVDLSPESEYVIKSDALAFLQKCDIESVDEIYSKNLIEHIPNVGELFRECFITLRKGGKLTIITDNAEFLPFYIPLIHRYGLGAHSSNQYIKNYKYKRCNYHYSLFTKLHLENHVRAVGFTNIKIKRITFGSRLQATAIK